jgi:hypothetical protein
VSSKKLTCTENFCGFPTALDASHAVRPSPIEVHRQMRRCKRIAGDGMQPKGYGLSYVALCRGVADVFHANIVTIAP